MPRLTPSLFWKARSISSLAPLLLPHCRTIPSTLNELRWIREHAETTPSRIPPRLRYWLLCMKRGSGIPLQYVLGTQPFGELDVLCRPGVLIPRPETEASTIHLASIMSSKNSPTQPSSPTTTDSRPTLRILDLCTGTGCIALLLYARLQLSHPSLHVHGVDVSDKAVSLARANRRASFGPSPPSTSEPQSITFSHGDIFSAAWLDKLVAGSRSPGMAWDVLVSNPPYISAHGFARSTARSVRNHEPRLALVPDRRHHQVGHVWPEDVFYARLLEVATAVGTRVVLFEVADMGQAARVARMVMLSGGRGGEESGTAMTKTDRDDVTDWHVEIWRDVPDASAVDTDGPPTVRIGNKHVNIRGSGRGRCVYAYRHLPKS